MCLDLLRKDKRELKIPEENGEYVGYRVFNTSTYNNLKPMHIFTQFYYKIGVWLNEYRYRPLIYKTKDSTIRTWKDFREIYKPGFHIFRSKSSADHYCRMCKYYYGKTGVVRKVYFRNVTAVGYQEGKVCYVAQKMYIIP